VSDSNACIAPCPRHYILTDVPLLFPPSFCLKHYMLTEMSVLLLLLLLLQYLALKVCAAAFTYESGASDQRMIVDLAKKITCKRKGPKKGEHSSYPRI